MEIHEITLPEDVQGSLYLSDMPGMEKTWTEAQEELSSRSIDQIVCLVPRDQWKRLSPDYAGAFWSDEFPWKGILLEMPERGFPPDLADFFRKTDQLAENLKEGEKVLIHCDTGKGRSGTLSIAILIRLGIDQLEAFSRVADAASGVETSEQETLIESVVKLHQDVVELELDE